METAAIVPNDYVGFWKLDETTGTAVADAYTAAPHNGALWNGGTANQNGAAWGAGKVGNALTFDGSNDSVRIPDFSYGPAFSVAFWFRIADTSGTSDDAHLLLQHGTMWTANNVAVAIPKGGGGTIYTYVTDSNDPDVFGFPVDGTFDDGAWHHYVLTVGSCASCPDNTKAYLDGQLRLAVGRGGDAFTPATPIFLGLRTDGSSKPLNGGLDEVRLYNRALTTTEARDIYVLTTPDDYVGRWKLDESTGTTAADDYAAAPHPGTLWNAGTSGQNGPAWTAGGMVGVARSLTFDGSNDSVRIADFSYGPSLSLAFWFKITNNAGSSGQYNLLFNHGTLFGTNSLTVLVPRSGDAGAGEIWTYVVDTNDATSGIGVAKPSGGSWADAAWHHYAVTVGACPTCADNTKIYVDGVLKTQTQRGGDSINPATPIFLGLQSNGTGHPLAGQLDDVRLYNRTLLTQDVADLKAFSGAVCANGVLEAGEDCESPFDACCNSSTCKFAAAGSSCADTTPTDCKAPHCTGTSAACNQNAANAADTAACGDGVCDQCSSGTCVPTVAGGSGPGCVQGAAECSYADTCSGAGSCLANDWTNGSSCATGTCTTGVCQATPAPPNDYLSFWRFDEGAGTAATDSATTPHHGVLHDGATAGANGPAFTSSGRVGSALAFDGSNDHVRVADFSYGAALSVAFWFKINGNAGTGGNTLFEHGTMWSSNNMAVTVLKDSDPGAGEIWTYVSDSNDATSGFGVAKPSGSTWADNQWHHYTLTVGSNPSDAANAKVYVDGVQKITFQRGGDAMAPTTSLFFGTRSDMSHPLGGLLDEVRLYNRALSGSEVTAIVNDVTPPPPPPPPPPVVTMSTVTYGVDTNPNLLNPERGWSFHMGDSWAAGAMNQMRTTDEGWRDSVPGTISVLLIDVDEDSDDISSVTTNRVVAALNAARTNGVKVIPRVSYYEVDSAGNYTDGHEPSKARMLLHIAELMPIFNQHADVIAALQLGWVGAWGEWNHSPMLGYVPPESSGFDDSYGNALTQAVANAAIDGLIQTRMVQFRTPKKKEVNFGRGQLADSEAFNGTRVARSGHFNDCFLRNEGDSGTYDGCTTPEACRAFVAQDTRFTPMGGETCAKSTFTNCTNAKAQLRRMHWSYLHNDYQQAVVGDAPTGQWATDGCRDEIASKLGYRFVLTQTRFSQSARSGQIVELEVKLRNDGYATPWNERPVYVVLQGGGHVYTAKISPATDPRRWESGDPTPPIWTIAKRLRLPALTTGDYTLALWLPDAAGTLQTDSRYSVRLANTGTWSDTTGYNTLTTASQKLAIDPNAPDNNGGVPDADFIQIQ